MRKPNFFMIGAPKWGTMPLHHYVSDRLRSFMSKAKEPGFCYTDIPGKGRLSSPAAMSASQSLRSSAYETLEVCRWELDCLNFKVGAKAMRVLEPRRRCITT